MQGVVRFYGLSTRQPEFYPFPRPEGSPAIALRNTSRDRERDQNRDQTRINDRIRVSPIRVIAADGEQLGVLPTEEAMSIAREAGLDLVIVAPGAKPPVCRIMDYGKYKYQQSKKQHKNQSHHTKTKEIRLRPKTGDHDIEFKVKQAIGFLKHKDKVQVCIQFKGREMAHVEEGHRVMAQVIELLAEVGKLESPPKQMGRRIMATVSPKAG